jgi:asparagine synthase (glutamine-hydrolysing)
MCGIAGLVDPSLAKPELAQRIARMAETLVHRGPDDDGFLIAEGVALGMRRLSIIDVEGGQQPLYNEDGTVAVVQNGEIYNFRQLRAELSSRHAFQTRADTEVIVHAYEDEGADAIARLHGMFGLALWDERRRLLLLARDRLGKKPLYYAHDGQRLVFGSEIKALLASDPALAEIDDETLLPYLRYGYVPEPRTMFRRIRVLPPGHILTFSSGELVIRPYWQLELAPNGDTAATLEDHVEELDSLLADAVSSRLVSDVPLGLFLSGGLDSSTLTAYAARESSSPVKTFTIGFDREAWDESADAAQVARHLGSEHHSLILGEQDVQRTLPDTVFDLVRHFDQPFGDPSALPTYHVSRLAREHVTVILGGDGADEIFAGYSTYRGTVFAQRYRRLPGARFGPSLVRAIAKVVPRGRRYGLLHAVKVLGDSVLPFEELYLRKRTILRRPDLERLLTPELGPRIAASEPPAYVPQDVVSALELDASWIDRMSYCDVRFGLLNDMLVKVDRMSMAHSLEVRSPFLDHKLVEFVLRLPPERKFNKGTTKVVLRDTIRDRLPAATMSKPKQGFNVPLREWFRGGLSSFCEDLLVGSNLLPEHLFQREAVSTMLRRHRNGEVDHNETIWLLLNYAAWRSQYAAERIGALPSSPVPQNAGKVRMAQHG